MRKKKLKNTISNRDTEIRPPMLAGSKAVSRVPDWT
jgi:hypothetical protein